MLYSSCPCCAFSTNDLFLPPSERQDDDDSSKRFLPPLESLQQLSTTPLVDTHGHAHLQRENDDDSEYHDKDDTPSSNNIIISLTCAVSPSDWEDCLKYAAQYKHRRAAIGVHPWYLNELLDVSSHDDSTPQLNATWLSDMELLLQQHPGCMVGEVGLCKMARFVRTHAGGKTKALQMQREVLEQQLQLAVQYQRPVSIHCVQQQGVLLEIFRQSLSPKCLPPAMALHSFSGTAHQIQQLLQWEQSLQRDKPLLYFGFSHMINYAMCTSEKAKRQTQFAIRQVPPDRLLSESDVHHDKDVAAGTAGAVALLAFVLDKPLLEVAEQTRENGLRFLSTLSNGMEEYE